MESMKHVFTKQGDSGYTKLYDGASVDKDHIFIETNGHFDELTSHIGLVKTELDNQTMMGQLETIQSRLIQLMGVIAGYNPSKDDLDSELIAIETWIMDYEKMYPAQKKFILPGKSILSTRLDVTRSVCRRAERSFVKCHRERRFDPIYLKYVNRLSDYFYVAARYTEFIQLIEEKVKEVIKSIQSEGSEGKATTGSDIALTQANALIEKIKAKALELGMKVVIAVTNKEGNPIAVQVMDDAYIASYDIAVNKAFTSVSLKMTTDQLSELAKPGSSLYGIQFTNNGRIVIFGGGTPLIYKNQIIGGLGVSGGSTEEDTLLAEYGAKLLEEIYRLH